MITFNLHHIEKITFTDTEKLVNPGSGDLFWSRTMMVNYKGGAQPISLFSNVSADALKISTPDPVRDQLVEALQGEHKACDWLMARLIDLDPDFLPTKSPIWAEIQQGHAALVAADAARDEVQVTA